FLVVLIIEVEVDAHQYGIELDFFGGPPKGFDHLLQAGTSIGEIAPSLVHRVARFYPDVQSIASGVAQHYLISRVIVEFSHPAQMRFDDISNVLLHLAIRSLVHIAIVIGIDDCNQNSIYHEGNSKQRAVDNKLLHKLKLEIDEILLGPIHEETDDNNTIVYRPPDHPGQSGSTQLERMLLVALNPFKDGKANQRQTQIDHVVTSIYRPHILDGRLQHRRRKHSLKISHRVCQAFSPEEDPRKRHQKERAGHPQQIGDTGKDPTFRDGVHVLPVPFGQ